MKLHLNLKASPALFCATVSLGLTLPSTLLAATANVSIVDFAFVPARTNIALNDTVVWTWQPGAQNHNVTSSSIPQAWTASATLNGPATFTNTFPTSGVFPYLCTIHGFTGQVTVGNAGPALTVSLTSPSPGAIITAPANLVIAASVSGGTASSVDFYTNSILAGSVSTSPFDLTLSNLPAGPYSLMAIANGVSASATSSVVNITVVSNALSVLGTPPNKDFNKAGNLLIADQLNNRVVEIEPSGQIVWTFGLGPQDFSPNSILGCNDAERVGSLTLLSGTGTPSSFDPDALGGAVDNRVMLVDAFGRPVWQYGQFGQTGSGPDLLSTPVQAAFLPSYHVLITDQGNNRIIEVDLNKDILWQYPGDNTNADAQLNSPNSAELLGDGNILVADELNNRAIEVTRGDVIVNTFSAGGTVVGMAFASRLANGDTLLTDYGNARVVEVNSHDAVVWEYVTTNSPGSIAAPQTTRGIRLSNGNTLITDQLNNRVIEVNHAKKIVASYGLPLAGGTNFIGNNFGYNTNTVQRGLFAPYDAKRIGDYTGLTPPMDNTNDGYNMSVP